MVEDGANGLLVDGEDPAAIAAAITRVLTEPGLGPRLAAGGLARAHAAGWPERAGAFNALCESPVGRDGTRVP